jgi:stage IV sporulation protein FB
MFVCVLLHEFGHVTAARWYGIRTPDILLLPIGGVARLERMPTRPWEELVVALCGPLVNIIIAVVLALFVGLPRSVEELVNELGHLRQAAMALMGWNLMMVVFNMIPAFPMDGGRVLRALLAMVTGDFATATRWAAGLGQSLAVVVVVGMIFGGWFEGNPMLMLIAFFVFIAAGQEARMVAEAESARGVSVQDAMMTDFRTLDRHAKLIDAVTLLRSGSQADFPIMDEFHKVLGVLSRDQLIAALADHGTGHPVVAAMVADLPTLAPEMEMAEGLAVLRQCPASALPVVRDL